MADRRISTETLTDIADAIRAKTGGAAQLTPAQMVTEIGNISGGSGKTILANYTAAEDVSAIQIDFTQAMQGYDLYRVVMTGMFNKSPYPYVGVNTTTNSATLNAFSAYGAITSNTRWECFIGYVGGVHFLYAQNKETPITGGLQYFHAIAYSADAVFKAGFNIQIWGYTE